MGINFTDGQWPKEGKWRRQWKVTNWKSGLVCGFSSTESFASWTKEIININNDPSQRYVVGIFGGSTCIWEMPGLNFG
jgi:hypothetical protein